MTDPHLVAALGEALRAILSDFDREPDDEYMAVAVPMFLSLLAVHWPCDTAKIARAALTAVKEMP